MAYNLTAMQVEGKNGEIITLKERTASQIKKYVLGYMTEQEWNKYTCIINSQYVSECNGYTYAKFLRDGKVTTLAIYDNPELD